MIDPTNTPFGSSDKEEEEPGTYSYYGGAELVAEYANWAPACTHDWVNVSFMHIRMACKHCGKYQKDDSYAW